ncbi:hypothetical protein [Alicyclobacillus dauci]|uniref:Uncharacterized protein n=1 Tax=Alicyclobacillus dauci TaxID=1475485 RepID=A0ABY6Z7T7_9BACL|nr:hypothetical protein [Alicyclobacillus dauci]WAH38758.1 hypothetical protein NZD86_09890 [Alicyclobacillus dauci]
MPIIEKDINTAESAIRKGPLTPADNNVLKDLDNAQKMAVIASQTHNATGLLYLHRIASDLSEWCYGDVTDGKYWGDTITLNGDNVDQLEQYIKDNEVTG